MCVNHISITIITRSIMVKGLLCPFRSRSFGGSPWVGGGWFILGLADRVINMEFVPCRRNQVA